MTEIEALKLVTLNPAKLLNLDDKIGSIKVGKDADLVLWTDHPLSIYSKPSKTIVDNIVDKASNILKNASSYNIN